MQQQLAKMGDVVYMAGEEKNVISLCVDGKMIDLAANSRSSKSGFVLTSDNVIRMFDVPKDNHDEAVITVPHGQMATIMLDDSTKVTLNAGSTFAFPCHFDKDGFRKVKLQGEGYFEVKHDEQHPFVVNGKQLDVTVSQDRWQLWERQALSRWRMPTWNKYWDGRMDCFILMDRACMKSCWRWDAGIT